MGLSLCYDAENKPGQGVGRDTREEKMVGNNDEIGPYHVLTDRLLLHIQYIVKPQGGLSFPGTMPEPSETLSRIETHARLLYDSVHTLVDQSI
jgi:hypothetical protein